jgi:hypothetical protein
MKSLWQLARAALLSGLLVAGSGAFAQRTPVPLKDFEAIPVASPTTAERVVLAWRAAALRLAWQVQPQPDGTLLVSTVKNEDYPVKLRVTFDAAKYSVAYVSSENLKHGPPPPLGEWNQSARRYQLAAAEQVARFKGSPESPFAVTRPTYIHPFYESWVRELLTEVRLQLDLPTRAPASATGAIEEAGVKLPVPGPVVAGRRQARSVSFKDAGSRQWQLTRFEQALADPRLPNRDRADEALRSFRDDASRRRLQSGGSAALIVDEPVPDGGTLVVMATETRRTDGREVDSHVDFRIVWPARLPDGHVQGTIDWSGELQPGLGEVLNALRKMEPAR